MNNFSIVGKSVPKADSLAKATGTALYADDIKLPGMLHGCLKRSSVSHARIIKINTKKAEALPGVKCVITGNDIPKVKYGNWRLYPETQDEYALAIDRVRFIGDEIAAVAARNKKTAQDAVNLIEVEYDLLPAVFDVDTATKNNAPVIHDLHKNNISVVRDINYGDIKKAFKKADYVREDTFTVHAVSHAYLEPCSCLSQCDQDGKITIWTSTQTPYIVQCLLASTLGIRENDVRVIKPTVGGGFGGKMELRPWEFCSAFMAKKTGRPVKFTISREEELTTGRRRHPMKITSKVGFKTDGTLIAKDVTILLDGGAYNSMGPTATFLSGNFGAMLYKYPNYRFRGKHVYTNKPPAGAMRGFGAPQSLFVSETQMNIAAENLGIDPIEIRLINAMETGDVIPQVATISSCGFRESLENVRKNSDWKKKRKKSKNGYGIGIGCYSFLSGGVFNWFNTKYPFSAAEVRVFSDGTAHLLTMASDIGQGSDTTLKQILAEELGLKMEDIRLTAADTAMTPQGDLGTWGSRVTLMAGNAVIDAARKIKEKLYGAVSLKFNLNVIYDMECKDGRVQAKGKADRGIPFGEAVEMIQKINRGMPLLAHGYYTPRNKGLVSPAFSFGAQVVELIVDKETGLVDIKKIWTVHDCGTVINPIAVEGQLDGSIQMALGYTLSEELVDKKGETLNKTFLDYKMPGSLDMPEENHSECLEIYEPEGPMGAKEAGEGLVSPTAPAIADAVYHATGYRCLDLPIKPEKIVKALKK